jgi:hypothetical protein
MSETTRTTEITDVRISLHRQDDGTLRVPGYAWDSFAQAIADGFPVYDPGDVELEIAATGDPLAFYRAKLAALTALKAQLDHEIAHLAEVIIPLYEGD